MADLTSILVILSKVTTALISMTTATYAIGLPLLKRRMRDSLSKSRSKRQNLKEDLERSLRDEDFVKNTKSPIEVHEQDEKRIYDQ
jgi:hypothetical protein